MCKKKIKKSSQTSCICNQPWGDQPQRQASKQSPKNEVQLVNQWSMQKAPHASTHIQLHKNWKINSLALKAGKKIPKAKLFNPPRTTRA